MFTCRNTARGEHCLLSEMRSRTPTVQDSHKMHNLHHVKQLNNTIQDSKNEGNQANYLETFKNDQKTQSVGQTRPTSSMARDTKKQYFYTPRNELRRLKCFLHVPISVSQSVSPVFLVSATPLKPLNRISWNCVDMKDIMCNCAYAQNILIQFFFLSELCPF